MDAIHNYLTTLQSIYLTDITIHESLGGGNFGEVFRGTWHGSTVALKLFKSETDYIDNEIQLLKKLNHSNIVRYFGIHVSSEMVSYIVMEFMQYGNLNMFLQSKKDSNELKNSILIDMYECWLVTSTNYFKDTPSCSRNDVFGRTEDHSP